MYLFVILHNIYIYMYMYMYGFIMCILCMGRSDALYLGVYVFMHMSRDVERMQRLWDRSAHHSRCQGACLSQSWGQPSYRCDAAIDLPGFDILFHTFLEENLMPANIRATKPSNQRQPRASTLTTFQIRTWDRHESGMRHSKRISVAQRMINDLWFGVLRS